jgi:class 3 adenylate cyclase
MTGRQSQSIARGFLFADLRGYSAYVERHGDRAGADLLVRYRDLVRAAVREFDGAEIRTEGDSFYLAFDSPSAALLCGLAILSAAGGQTDASSDPILVGIGVHAGETVTLDEGYVGSAVNIAARVCAQAKAGELLATDAVRALTRTYLDVTFEPAGRRRLKGIGEPMAVYRVLPPGASPSRRPIGL